MDPLPYIVVRNLNKSCVYELFQKKLPDAFNDLVNGTRSNIHATNVLARMDNYE